LKKRLAHLLQELRSIGEMTNLSKISNEISESSASMIEIDEASEGQRIDNFLAKSTEGRS